MSPAEAVFKIHRAFEEFRAGSLTTQQLELQIINIFNSVRNITEITNAPKFEKNTTVLHEQYYREMGIKGEEG